MSTLDALMKRVGLLRNQPDHPLAGRMLAILDVASRLPQRIWRTDDDRAHDQRFWDDILPHIPTPCCSSTWASPILRGTGN